MRGIRVAHEAIQRFRQESLEGADGEQTVSPVQQVSTQHPIQDEYTSPKGAEAMNTSESNRFELISNLEDLELTELQENHMAQSIAISPESLHQQKARRQLWFH